MQREERLLDSTIDTFIQRILDIKNSLQQLIMKLETQGENSDWPQYLDAFSVISAQIVSLLKVMRNDKAPNLRNYLTLPLQLKAETDEQLLKITGQRVPAFDHDFVPNLLRTKPEPEVETKLQALENKVSLYTQDMGLKQVAANNKVVKNVLDVLNHAREEWESENSGRLNQPITCSINETQFLLAAQGLGKGIKIIPVRPPQPSPNVAPVSQPAHPAKAQSTIKTNIKAANQVHPYSR